MKKIKTLDELKKQIEEYKRLLLSRAAETTIKK